MGLRIHVRIEGHDWENDLHYGFVVPIELSAFEQYPQYLCEQLERYRREMETKYKKDFIEKGHHLKLINTPLNT